MTSPQSATFNSPAHTELRWPGGLRIAAIANIAWEGWAPGTAPGISPMGNPLPAGDFDANAASWGAYGGDHGIRRLTRILDRAGVRGSIMTCGVLADRRPDLLRRLVDSGHEIIAHSYSMDVMPPSLSREEDARNIEKTTDAIERVTGSRPQGWASPRNTAGPFTIEALAAAGYRWHSDAMDADLPYKQTFAGTNIVAIPFGMDVNDLPHAMRFGRTPRQYVEIFDDVVAHLTGCDDETVILDVTAHAHNYGRPGCAWAYDTVVRKLVDCGDIWLATREQIVDHLQSVSGL